MASTSTMRRMYSVVCLWAKNSKYIARDFVCLVDVKVLTRIPSNGKLNAWRIPTISRNRGKTAQTKRSDCEKDSVNVHLLGSTSYYCSID